MLVYVFKFCLLFERVYYVFFFGYEFFVDYFCGIIFFCVDMDVFFDD